MLDYYLIVIGASAGGLEPLKNIISSLPKNFPAALLIVKHISSSAENVLPNILSRVSKLPVIQPGNNHTIEPGHIYIAPPKFHMIIENGKIQLKKGPRINHSIPAIDPLFYSAALHNKSRTIGILLSGLLDDGSAGLLALKKYNGIAIVQDLKEAEYQDMPSNGCRATPVDYCLPAVEIEAVLKKIVNSPININSSNIPDVPLLKTELNMNFTETDSNENDMHDIGAPSVFSCPECNGVLWQVHDESLERYRCRVGHAFGLDSLVNNKEKNTDAALWAALRALEEKKNLANNLISRAKKENSKNLKHFQKKAHEVEEHIQTIRKILQHSKYSS